MELPTKMKVARWHVVGVPLIRELDCLGTGAEHDVFLEGSGAYVAVVGS